MYRTLNELMIEIAASGLSKADGISLAHFANRIRNDHQLPNLSCIQEEQRQDICYLIERLSQDVSFQRRRDLMTLLSPYRPVMRRLRHHRDDLANLWGAREEISSRIQEMMPTQTDQEFSTA